MADNILGTLKATGENGEISAELKRHLDGQSRAAKAIKASADAISAGLAAFKAAGAQGAMLFKGASDWQWLAPGTSGQFLRTNGAAADPSWGSVPTYTNLAFQSTTSGTTKDFTVPSTASLIILHLNGVSLNGTNDFLVRLGTSGGFVSTGYQSNSFGVANTTGFVCGASIAASILYGPWTFYRGDGNVWTGVANLYRDNAGTPANISGQGIVSLGGDVTQIRFMATGANSFDAGSVGCSYL